MIPFLGRHEQVARCLGTLLEDARPDTVFLLVDDGSTPPAIRSVPLQPMLCKPNVHLIHHRDNYGVAAARNSGLHWCRERHIDIVIMIDSDCMPEPGFVHQHLQLHSEHPEAACIGGLVIGEGDSFWAKVDGLLSWVHASPHLAASGKPEFRRVEHPYHLPTTNFSVKLARLPAQLFVFDERLKTGEDCLLVRELRARGEPVYFSSLPTVYHDDRESCWQVLKHHYEWGHHQYFIQLGNNISPRCFHPLYRAMFVLVFVPLLPVFALVGTWLNLRHSKPSFNPAMYVVAALLWFAKGIAVLEAAMRPRACLRQARQEMIYELALLDNKGLE